MPCSDVYFWRSVWLIGRLPVDGLICVVVIVVVCAYVFVVYVLCVLVVLL